MTKEEIVKEYHKLSWPTMERGYYDDCSIEHETYTFHSDEFDIIDEQFEVLLAERKKAQDRMRAEQEAIRRARQKEHERKLYEELKKKFE
jgi:hypothetical protein